MLSLLVWMAACAPPAPDAPPGSLRFEADAAGWRLDDPGRDLHAMIDVAGVRLHRTGEAPSLSLAVTGPVRALSGTPERVEVERDGLLEWFEVTPRGVQQGFTVDAPGPEGDVEVRLAAGGPLTARVLPDHRAVAFLDARDRAVWRYEGLRAWDAAGRTLPARLDVDGEWIVLQVEASEARFPVTIDPWIVGTRLVRTPGGSTGEQAGWSVAIDGDLAVVGAPESDPSGTGAKAGAAYVYEQAGGAWTLAKTLSPSGLPSGARFGESVDVAWERILVGAPDDQDGAPGAAYLFERDLGGTDAWGQRAVLTDATGVDLGAAVTLGSDLAVVGDPGWAPPGGGTAVGQVGVYGRDTGGSDTWGAATTFGSSDPADNHRFGAAVDLSGDLLLVGEPGNGKGTAWVFDRASTWGAAGQLSGDTTASGFGTSVALDGKVALVGSPADTASGVAAGAAYLFDGSTGTWALTTTIEPKSPSGGDGFGAAVTWRGTRGVVGAPFDDDLGGTDDGGAFRIEDDGAGGATLYDPLLPDAAGENFGASVAMTDAMVAVGAPLAGDGALYLYPTLLPPVLDANAGLTVLEDSTTTLTAAVLSVSDPDTPDKSALLYTVTAGPAEGSVPGTFTQADIEAGSVAYAHSDDTPAGSDGFTFEVSDGTGNLIGPFVFSITVYPVNDPPVISASSMSTCVEDQLVTITSSSPTMLVSTDPDHPAASDLTYTITSGPSWGQLEIGGGKVTTFTQANVNDGAVGYDHFGSENVSDAFAFRVTDPLGAFDAGTFTLTCTGVNDPPAATGGTLTLDEGAAAAVSPVHLQATDDEDGPGGLTWTVQTGPANGTLRKNGSPVTAAGFTQADVAAGAIDYLHDGTDTTTDAIALTLTDTGNATGSATLSVVVNPVDDPPVIQVNKGLTVAEGAVGTVDASVLVTSYGDDPLGEDPSVVTYTLTEVPAHGDLVKGTALLVGSTFTQEDVDNSGVTYEHDDSETTSDQFAFTVADATTTLPEALFRITITPVDDPPKLEANTGLTLDEGSQATIGNGALRVEDPDDAASTLVFTIGSGPSYGDVLVSGAVATSFTQADLDAGLVAYTHHGNDTEAADAFTFSMPGLVFAPLSTTFTLTIDPVNDPPIVQVANGPSCVEGQAGTFTTALLQTTDADPGDGPADLVYTITSGPAHGTLQVDGGDVTTFTQADIDASGIVVTYLHDGTPNLADAFSFTVSDPAGATDTGTVALACTEDNDLPIATAGTLTLDEGASAAVSPVHLLATDEESASAALTWTVDTAPQHGTLRKDGGAVTGAGFTQADVEQGRIDYLHDGSDTTSDTIDLVLTDGGSLTDTATLSVVVNPVDDPPVITKNDGLLLDEDAVGLVDEAVLVTSWGDDPPEAPSVVLYTVTEVPAHGPLLKNGPLNVGSTFTQQDLDDGLVTYDHDGGETTSDQFAFTVGDATTTLPEALFRFTITPLDDAPDLVTNATLTVDEGGQGTLGTSVLRVDDPDDASDTLVYTVDEGPSHGEIRVGGASASTFTQADVDAGIVVYHHDGDDTSPTDSFAFSMPGGIADTFDIAITPVNDPPSLDVNETLHVDEGQSALVDGTILSTSDPDDLPSLRVYTLDRVPAYGVLRLSGVPLAQYGTFTQADISGGSVSYLHLGSETLADDLLFTVADAAGLSIGARLAIVVTPVNDAPTVGAEGPVVVAEGGQTVLSRAVVRADDVDDGPAQITLQITTAPTAGDLFHDQTQLGALDTFTQKDLDEATIRYVHDGSEGASDGFALTASDLLGANVDLDIEVQVTPVDDPPTLPTNLGATVVEGQTIPIDDTELAAADVDSGDGSLVFTLGTIPAHGVLDLDGDPLVVTDTFSQVDLAAGLLHYAHDGTEPAPDAFAFTLSDGTSELSATFAIAVTPDNDPPVVVNEGPVAVDEGGMRVIGRTLLLATDPDDDAAGLEWTLDTAPTGGTLWLGAAALSAGSTFTQQDVDDALLTYQHAGGETATDGFDLTVRDPDALADTASVVVNVALLDDPPTIAVNEPLELDEDAIGDVDTTVLSISDPDTATTARVVTLVSKPANGMLRLSDVDLDVDDTFTQDDLANGRVTYDHDGSETTEDGFDFLVSDGTTDVQGTFAIDVAPVNDGPLIVTNTGITVTEGDLVALDGTALAASDVDDGPSRLTWTLATPPAAGTLRRGITDLGVDDTFTQAQVDAGLVIYLHAGGEAAGDTFVLDLSDLAGATVAGETVLVTVQPVDDPPVLGLNAGASVQEAGGVTLDEAVLRADDVDTVPGSLVFTVQTPPAHGTLNLGAGPALQGGDTFTQADVDAEALVYTHLGGEDPGDAFTFALADATTTLATASFTLTVDPVDDPPVLATNAGLTLFEGTTAAIGDELAATDVDTLDPSLLRFTLTAVPEHGVLTIGDATAVVDAVFSQADLDAGDVAYAHDGSETTADAFSFTLEDATTTLPEATFDITVDQENDAPVIDANEPLEVDEGGEGTIGDALLHTIDAESGAAALTYTVTEAPEHGSLLLDGALLGTDDTFTQADVDAGLLVYTHIGDEATVDGFSFEVADSQGGTASGRFTVLIGAANDPPVIEVNEVLEVPEGGSATLGPEVLQATDADDGPADLVFTVDAVPVAGVLRAFGAPLAAGETFTQADVDALFVSYTHDGSETGADSLSLTVADPSGAEDGPATFDIAVTPVNDRPVAVDDGPYRLLQDTVLVVETGEGILLNDTDVEGDGLSAVLSHGVVNGTLEIAPEGGFTYTPHPGFSGADRFTYLAFDGTAPSNVASVIVMVDPLPDTGDTGDTGVPGVCECAVGPSAPVLAPWALLLGLFVRRRRRV